MSSIRLHLLAVCLAAGCVTAAVADDFVTVTVQGEGISPEAAKNNALRKALEAGGKQEISSHSQVENFELVRDTIYARAEGIVTDYKVLQEGPGMGGTYFCKIEAKVNKTAIASSWGAVQNVLDQLGRPSIAVCITEKIDGVIDNSSILESKIEERLIKSGFDVYNRAHLLNKAGRESADAAAEDNIAKLMAVAKDYGTQIFISGAANANQAGITEAAGTKIAMYNGDCMVKMYYTDTGKLIASESLPNWRGGARGQFSFSPQAGKMALSNAGGAIVEKVYQTCMRQWATRISSGDMIELEIEGIKVGQAIKLKKRLKKIEGVLNVHYRMTKGIATYRIKAKMGADTLVEHLVEGEWESLIEIVDVKMNRIQAKGIGG